MDMTPERRHVPRNDQVKTKEDTYMSIRIQLVAQIQTISVFERYELSE